jgi:hypothetical protein
MKKRVGMYVCAITGIVLLILGLVILKTIEEPEGIIRVLPYICIGVGCGLFGHGMGEIASCRLLKNSPEIIKQIEIEKNDERNVVLAARSKAKAFDMMTFVYGALMLSFALMQVELAAVLLLVAAYLFVEVYAIFCRFRLEREM